MATNSDFLELIKRLSEAGGVPIALTPQLPPVIDTGKRLSALPRLTVAFPPCADELLSLVRNTEQQDTDEITRHFEEYFKFRPHKVLGQFLEGSPPAPRELDGQLKDNLDAKLIGCVVQGAAAEHRRVEWPTECCICSPCVTLDGNRNRATAAPGSPGTAPVDPSLRRLYVGDAVWLFYFERMGIFQILGAILDAFAYTGRLPISNGSLEKGVRDDLAALVLEVMIRQTKTGMSSTVRDRASTYMRSIGWQSSGGKKLSLDAQVNSSFNTLLHKFFSEAGKYLAAKQLAVAIRGSAGQVAPPSVATLTTISDTLDVLKKRFEAFDYGRNYYNTLSGIVWAIAGMSVIRELRTTLGIPPAYDAPHEYIPAAYDILVLKRPVTNGDTNRYLVHRECARNARDILLDLEVIDHTDRKPGGELENWLTQVEAKIEGYRTAYKTLTGVDPGSSSAVASLEHQAE
jgi:hypothetical protein